MYTLKRSSVAAASRCLAVGVRCASGSMKDTIKTLRLQTSAGLLDCKKALTHSEGDLEGAVKWLEERGIAKADKKRGRVAASGLVGACRADKGLCVVELNSESDFVAKTDGFKDLLRGMDAIVAAIEAESASPVDACNADALNAHPQVASAITNGIATTGENIVLRRSRYIPTPQDGHVGIYVHNKTQGLDTAGVLVAVVSLLPEREPRTPEALAVAANRVAQHLVAESMSEDDGTPLREQKFMQTERTVGGFLKGKAKEAGCRKIEIVETLLWRCGEGIEVEATNFAEEVESMKQASQA